MLRYTPVIMTVALICWTIGVSPYSRYGDRWAIFPAVAVFPVIVGLHLVLILTEKAKIGFLIYAAAHIGAAFIIWIYCLMKISKDSL